MRSVDIGATGQVRQLLLLGDALDPVVLGNLIRRLRRGLGMTQAELAEGLVTPAHISRIESGDRVPSASLLREFADRLGVTADHFFSGEVGRSPAPTRAVRAADAAAAWLAAPQDPAAYNELLEAVAAWTASRARQHSPDGPDGPDQLAEEAIGS